MQPILCLGRRGKQRCGYIFQISSWLQSQLGRAKCPRRDHGQNHGRSCLDMERLTRTSQQVFLQHLSLSWVPSTPGLMLRKDKVLDALFKVPLRHQIL